MTRREPSAQPPPRHRLSALAAYGALRGPLALLELPLFVLLPAFYAAQVGIGIGAIGAILLVTRLFDAVADPLIGAVMDRAGRTAPWRRWILAAMPVLVIGFTAIFLPPEGALAGWWLALFSIVVYAAYSVVSIAYQSWGAALGDSAAERVRITAIRESFGLGGVVISAGFMTTNPSSSLVPAFALASLLAGVALLRAPLPAGFATTGAASPGVAPTADVAPTAGADVDVPPRQSPWRSMSSALRDADLRWLLAAFAASGIATAIPATLVLFFIADVLHARDAAPQFLLLYFVCAAISMPAWTWLAARLGLRNTWIAGIGLSVIGFVWTLGLAHGDTLAFALVCMITGIALAADLAIPPAILASLVDRERGGLPRATSFGVWNLVTKLNLALAAGIGLPLLSAFGYVPSPVDDTPSAIGSMVPDAATGAGESGSDGMLALTLVYAGLPCLLKLIAAFLLVISPRSAVGESTGPPITRTATQAH